MNNLKIKIICSLLSLPILLLGDIFFFSLSQFFQNIDKFFAVWLIICGAIFCPHFGKNLDLPQFIDDTATDEFDAMLKHAKENKEKNKPIPEKRYIKKS
jgi:hypothetical protein